MRALSTRTDGRSSPLGKPVSTCWTSTTAPGRSTCPASKSTPAIKATASVAGSSSRFWRKHSARARVLDGPYTLSDGIAAFAEHSELHNGTGEMQPDHT